MKRFSSILFTILIDFISFGIISPIIGPLLTKSYTILGSEYGDEARNTVIGLLTATFSLFQFFSSPVLGSMSDKFGRKAILKYTVIASFFSYLVFAIGIESGSLVLLLVSRALGGIAAGNIAVIFPAIADISRTEEKAKNFGIIGAAFGIGFVLGPLLGGLLSDSSLVSWFTLTTPFYFTCFLCLINYVLIILYYQETNLYINQSLKIKWYQGFINFKKAWTNLHLAKYFAVVFLFVTGFTVFTQFYQLKLIRVFNYNQSGLSYYYAFIGICIIITQGIVVRKLNEKANPSKVVFYSLLIMTLGFLGLSLAETLVMVYVMSSIIALGQGMLSPFLSSLISKEASKAQQGETFGIQSAVQASAQILGPLLGGQLISLHINFSLWSGAILSAVAAVLFKILK